MDLTVGTHRAVIIGRTRAVGAGGAGNQHHLITIGGLGIGDGGQLGIGVGRNCSLGMSNPAHCFYIKVHIAQVTSLVANEYTQITILQFNNGPFRGPVQFRIVCAALPIYSVSGVDQGYILRSIGFIAVHRIYHNTAGSGNGITGRD